MKTIISIIAALLFSTLFYRHDIGMNLSLFSFLTAGILAFLHPHILILRSTIIYLSAYLITAIMVFFNHSDLAIFANCTAFFVVIGTFSESQSSIYIRIVNGLYSTIAGYFQRKFEAADDQDKSSWKQNIDFVQLSKLIAIPLIVIILFMILYKDGNPIFSDFIARINFDAIDFQLILFTVLGFFLFNNILNPVTIGKATAIDLTTKNRLNPTSPIQEPELKKEQQLGIVLMALLNVLLIFYSITDISYLLSNNSTSAVTLSNQVHNGINALIASILIAIFIILYFFRGNLNFYKHNSNLKNLSYTWIFLNILLVVLIAIKNNAYVTSFGFTYKRIGVYVYLCLTVAGLISTFFKVRNIQNLWYLFRVNTQVAFAFLIIASCIDWDYTITNYNLKHAQILDIDYLIDLTDNNAILLNDFSKQRELSEVQAEKITKKYDYLVQKVDSRKWQEWTSDNLANTFVK